MRAKPLIAMAVTGLLAAGPTLAQPAAPLVQTFIWNQTVPTVGRGQPVSPNALPPGFTNGTEQGQHAQALARWFAARGYAAAPNGF